ncbi:MAG: hypothetical protein ABI960_10720 [Candidatus Eisenbacteria bacterium]
MLARHRTGSTTLAVLLATCLGAARAFADSTSVNITTNEATKTAVTASTWYASPWVWAAAAGVFLIVVIALTTRGNRNP